VAQERAISRRSSYGPKSPVVGTRGARTRQNLLDAALTQFADSGFLATSVDDIARAAGVSRATLYQYFSSLEEIVVELLEECGAALMRVVRRLGSLGPDASGYDNLHWWLGEWAYVYDKYATMFIEWAHIDSPNAPLRPLLTKFVDGYTAAIARRVRDSAVEGIDAEHVSIALTTIIERFHYYLHTQDIPIRADTALDTLAVAVQLVLFPSTPASVFLSPGEALIPPLVRIPLVRRPPAVATSRRQAGDDELSIAAQRSSDALLDAGARVFNSHGYGNSSVDQILLTAGLSRRTFYKYFGNRLDLLVVLSERCAQELHRLTRSFAAIHEGGSLRTWIREFLDFQDRYGGVLRIWIEEPVDRAVQHRGDTSIAELIDAFAAVLRRQRRPENFDPEIAAWLLLALLERLPHQAVGSSYDLRGDALVEVITAFVERGMIDALPA
jgi:AcrR family transcriptional regulator